MSINPFYNLNTTGLMRMASSASLLINEMNEVGLNPSMGTMVMSTASNDIKEVVAADSIWNNESSAATGVVSHFDSIYSTIVPSGGLRLPGISSYVGYLVFAFRNPLLDFSYSPLKASHYNTLDRLWDSRPSSSAILGIDISKTSQFSGFLVDSQAFHNKLIRSNESSSNT